MTEQDERTRKLNTLQGIVDNSLDDWVCKKHQDQSSPKEVITVLDSSKSDRGVQGSSSTIKNTRKRKADSVIFISDSEPQVVPSSSATIDSHQGKKAKASEVIDLTED